MIDGVDMHHPLAQLGTRRGVTTDDYKAEKTTEHRQHLGCDLMYRREEHDPPLDRKGVSKDLRGTKLFYMPADALVVAAWHAEVVKVARESSGIHVKLRLRDTAELHDRYRGLVDDDTHLLHLHLRWACVTRGQEILGGTVIGAPGDDPRNPRDPIHLHLGQRNGAFGPYRDPGKWLKLAKHFPVRTR